MRRAPDLEDFRRDPTGRYLAGRTWIHFGARSDLFGIVFFGRPDRADIEALVRSLMVELGARVAPHRSLVDARLLTGVDAGAFALLHAYVREYKRELKERVERLALVRPEGMEGALVAGFYGVLEPPYPVEVFGDAAAAVKWLGDSLTIVSELAALVGAAAGVAPEVGALRARLSARLDLSIEEAGRALGLSERTLQRRLGDAGTTFQKEVARARLAEAERRMLDTDDPLTAVALDAGFASLQHFSQAFRKATGESPSAWRARRGRRR
jgi:AraC-like DNA-binding protein